MVLVGTLIVLGVWAAFVWYVDPDGLLRGRKDVKTENGC